MVHGVVDFCGRKKARGSDKHKGVLCVLAALLDGQVSLLCEDVHTQLRGGDKWSISLGTQLLTFSLREESY